MGRTSPSPLGALLKVCTVYAGHTCMMNGLGHSKLEDLGLQMSNGKSKEQIIIENDNHLFDVYDEFWTWKKEQATLPKRVQLFHKIIKFTSRLEVFFLSCHFSFEFKFLKIFFFIQHSAHCIFSITLFKSGWKKGKNLSSCFLSFFAFSQTMEWKRFYPTFHMFCWIAFRSKIEELSDK